MYSLCKLPIFILCGCRYCGMKDCPEWHFLKEFADELTLSPGRGMSDTPVTLHIQERPMNMSASAFLELEGFAIGKLKLPGRQVQYSA